jgi:large subunit ribosomal protein L4
MTAILQTHVLLVQKGTGRARFGSSRNPIWRGGGVVFGPRGNENYTKKLTTTSKRVAVKQALTLANQANKIVVDTFTFTEGKTKEAIALLDKHKINSNDRVLIVVNAKDAMTLRATSNVQQIKVVRPTYLNVFDILNADKVIISQESVAVISDWLAKVEK